MKHPMIGDGVCTGRWRGAATGLVLLAQARGPTVPMQAV